MSPDPHIFARITSGGYDFIGKNGARSEVRVYLGHEENVELECWVREQFHDLMMVDGAKRSARRQINGWDIFVVDAENHLGFSSV